jgi:hypothetical protein
MRILAVFTLALFLVTTAYVGDNLLSWQNSKDQLSTFTRFSNLLERQVEALNNLAQAVGSIPDSTSLFSGFLQELPSIQAQIDMLLENYKNLEKKQKLIVKKAKLKMRE